MLHWHSLGWDPIHLQRYTRELVREKYDAGKDELKKFNLLFPDDPIWQLLLALPCYLPSGLWTVLGTATKLTCITTFMLPHLCMLHWRGFVSASLCSPFGQCVYTLYISRVLALPQYSGSSRMEVLTVRSLSNFVQFQCPNKNCHSFLYIGLAGLTFWMPSSQLIEICHSQKTSTACATHQIRRLSYRPATENQEQGCLPGVRLLLGQGNAKAQKPFISVEMESLDLRLESNKIIIPGAWKTLLLSKGFLDLLG